MRFLLIICSLCFALSASAQDEVEFTVQKNNSYAGHYLFRTVEAEYGENKLCSYTLVSNNVDTTVYYRLGFDSLISKREEPISLMFKAYYTHRNDTTFAHLTYRNNEFEILPVFSKTSMHDVIPLSRAIWDNYTDTNEVYNLGDTFAVNVGGRNYQCIKLMFIQRVPFGETWMLNGEHMPGKETGYSIAYCYLRKGDYMLLKAETVEPLKEVKPNTIYPATAIKFEYYKTIE